MDEPCSNKYYKQTTNEQLFSRNTPSEAQMLLSHSQRRHQTSRSSGDNKWANIQKVNEKRFVDFHLKGLLRCSVWLFLGGLQKRRSEKKKVFRDTQLLTKTSSLVTSIYSACNEVCFIHMGPKVLDVTQPWLNSRWTVAQWAIQVAVCFK